MWTVFEKRRVEFKYVNDVLNMISIRVKRIGTVYVVVMSAAPWTSSFVLVTPSRIFVFVTLLPVNRKFENTRRETTSLAADSRRSLIPFEYYYIFTCNKHNGVRNLEIINNGSVRSVTDRAYTRYITYVGIRLG